jgi:hypothetical protein
MGTASCLENFQVLLAKNQVELDFFPSTLLQKEKIAK